MAKANVDPNYKPQKYGSGNEGRLRPTSKLPAYFSEARLRRLKEVRGE